MLWHTSYWKAEPMSPLFESGCVCDSFDQWMTNRYKHHGSDCMCLLTLGHKRLYTSHFKGRKFPEYLLWVPWITMYKLNYSEANRLKGSPSHMGGPCVGAPSGRTSWARPSSHARLGARFIWLKPGHDSSPESFKPRPAVWVFPAEVSDIMEQRQDIFALESQNLWV